ncbi:uncharacterized protein LOC113037576 [Astatotilapia calliptera]|uniref:uncharacterized protein LOC113037576 n=1 Tax=Astatotilapia calliptera TaxID=8154 RepID=UPI000E3FDFC2|nr:uncharacterized protein LOC113037576 [Astatotilapia calliptera]
MLSEQSSRGNPHLRQLKGFMSLMDELHEAQEVLQARELAVFARLQYSTPRPPQQPQQQTELATKQCELPATQQQPNIELSATPQRSPRQDINPLPWPQSELLTPVCSNYRSPASFLAAIWLQDEESASPPLPFSSAVCTPTSRRKHRSHHHSSLQPHSSPSNQQLNTGRSESFALNCQRWKESQFALSKNTYQYRVNHSFCYAFSPVTEQKYGGNVTLNCSVSTPKKCDQDIKKVKWIHNSTDVNREISYVKTSRSSCSATVTIMNFTYSNISPYDFMCVVRMHGIMEPFAFSPHLTSEETNSTTMSKNNTNTAVTEKKPGDNNSSISTPENCEHTKVKWIHNITVWCRLIVVVVSLATLITVVLIVNILTKAVAKAKMDGNMGYNEEDDETVKQENAQPSDEG